MSSIPAAALPVVPFLTVPRTVPASATARGARTSAPSKANLTEYGRLIARSRQPGAFRAAAALAHPSPDRSPRAPAPLHSQGLSSLLRSHLPSIFRNDTQNAGRADCHRWCRGAPAVGPALSDAAQDPRHLAECKI